MAYLLGASAVMESLQTDVRDIQSCVADIISRTGPVQCTSWKFPDKRACDLDIEDLLDLYGYSDDAEERQVAHIALYELVIDRLLLLMQTVSVFTDQVLKIASSEGDNFSQLSTNTSVGVVIKKYWSRLNKLKSTMKETVSERNAANRKVMELESDNTRLGSELKQTYNNTRPKTAGFGGLIPPNRAEMTLGRSLNPVQLKELGVISRDEYNKSCQTSETAFTPCDSCSIVQKSFRQSGEIIVNICQQQQIPSCLQKFRPQVSHLDWLSGNDVSRWSAEQNKDLQRISKLTATIQPMKRELSDCSEKCDKLEKRVTNFDRDLKRERDERSALHNQYEMKIKEIESQHTKTLELERQQRDLLALNKQELEKLLEKHKSELKEQQNLLQELELESQHTKPLELERQQRDLLALIKQELEKLLEKHKSELKEQQNLPQELESTKTKLEGELSSNKTNMSEVRRLEREMTDLQGRLDEISTKMDKSTKELQREQVKNKNVSKHTQSLQSKQESLLNRIDALDIENTELRGQVSTLEEEKDQFEDRLDDEKREVTSLQKKLKDKEAEIEHVQADKESLEQTIGTLESSLDVLNDKLEDAKERERLIVEYPDINGPVNPDLTGTGDIVLDMENQVKANNVRIELLEKQNDGLRNSITKLMNMQQQQQAPQQTQWATYVTTTGPQQLWNPNYTKDANSGVQIEDYDHRTEDETKLMNYDNYRKINNVDRDNRNRNNNSSASRPQPVMHTLDINSTIMQKHTKSTPEKDHQSNRNRPSTGSKSKISGEEFIVGKVSRPESAKSKRETTSSLGKSRPSSGKPIRAPVNTSSISAYLQLKRAGKLNLNDNIHTGAISTGSKSPLKPATNIPTSDSEYTQQDNFMCENCDKMYTRARDLDIHMSYCTGS